MKPSHCWTSIPHLFFMAVLCLTLNADNETFHCELEIKVQRNTVYKARVGEQLRINCPVQLCNNSPPTITWFKLEPDHTGVNLSNRVKIEWEIKDNVKGTSVLLFQNVISRDSGLYQCRSGNFVSHTINVTVEDVNVNGTLQNQTNSTPTADPNGNGQMWLYLYSAAGIIGFVFIVIVISVLSMKGCNGKPRKKDQNETQNIIPMVEQPSQHTSNQALPRGSPHRPTSPTSHRSSRKDPSAHTQRSNAYGNGDRERQRYGPEEEGVVYVAINHRQLAGAPRPQVVVEETSEYAAIRVS